MKGWQIPESWTIDPHRGQVSALALTRGVYQVAIRQGKDPLNSITFSTLNLTVEALLSEQIND